MECIYIELQMYLPIYFYIVYLRSVNWVLPGTSKEMYLKLK
jgi:hypothetical protein